jgi:hypothetical protein
MGTTRKHAPREGTKNFSIRVYPSKRALDEAIAQKGACDPKKCWHKVAVFAVLQKWCPDMNSNWVQVDAGHVKIRYKGWWYIADQARVAKESLLLFDDRKYDQLLPKSYTLNFRRQNKVANKPDSAARDRLNKINASETSEARRKRADYRKDMHFRVVGYAMI